MKTRKVVITYQDGAPERTKETTDNPFEIAWTPMILSVTFFLDGVEVGTVYAQ